MTDQALNVMNIGSGTTLKLEPVSCCICGANTGNVYFEGYDIEFRTCDNKFTFIQCSDCGHLYLSPRPQPADLPIIYSNYLTVNTDSVYHPSNLVASVKDNLFDKRRMQPVLKNLKDGSNVLDIGAGSGRLLRLLKRASPHRINLYANDIFFDEETKRAFQTEKIEILHGPIEEFDIPTKFDAITGIHLIEHVLDPPCTFRWISGHLNKGGVLYFETPDADAFIRRIFKDNWGMTHFPRHFNLFSKNHLAKLAMDSGLEVIHHGSTTTAPAWNMSIRNLLKMDAINKHNSILEIFNYSNVFTLGFFTVVDLVLMSFGIPTSTQQLIAKKI